MDYHITDMLNASQATDFSSAQDHPYRQMPYFLKPQLKAYFSRAIEGRVPMVVNCSAGKDRTGITAALMLTALGVPRSQVMQDYVLSTEYRRPVIERGDVDLAAVAKSNAFAAMMLHYSDRQSTQAAPLITEEGIPYLYYALAQIEADYGSVPAFLDRELGVSAADIDTLKTLYLQ
ncbi:tyrosine-protein phosphatase [Haliea sp. E17]|uniref:tyrosine-protein phosphatase n=1 Tax=Haliea sp. E17 TaxID=3401576 RepID=UPI003AAE583F